MSLRDQAFMSAIAGQVQKKAQRPNLQSKYTLRAQTRDKIRTDKLGLNLVGVLKLAWMQQSTCCTVQIPTY